MERLFGGIIWRTLCLATLLSANVYGDDQQPDASSAPAPSPMAELLERIRSAKGSYTPRTSEELGRQRSVLTEAFDRLDRYLTPGGENGRAWKRFLLWDTLRGHLAGRGPNDLRSLEQVYDRYHSDHAGLEMPVFRAVTVALGDYLNLAELLANHDAQTDFESQLERLAESLQAYQQAPQADASQSAGAAVGWLERYRQAPQVVGAVREQFGQANLHVLVSQRLIAAAGDRQVEETAPARDVILRTRISGTGRTTGVARTRLVPDPNRGLIETLAEATNVAQTVGRNGPARIYSSGRTRLVGRKWMMIDERGFQTWPATASARTVTSVHGVSSTKHGLMDRVVKRVAWKRIPRQKSQSEWIAARHAERTFSQRLDAEGARMMAQANSDYRQKFRGPLLRLGEFPRVLRFTTTQRQIEVVALGDGLGRLAAPTAAPPLTGDPALAVRLHESLVNNVANGLLAGRTLSREQGDKLSLELFGKLPPQLEEEDRQGPWALTFAETDPITLRIGQGEVSLTIRGRRFASDKRKFNDRMNITARYRLEVAGQAVKAVRVGEVEIFPPGFVSGEGEKIPLRLQTLRNLLKHRFEKIFTPEIASQGLVLPGHLQRAGRLDLTELQADRGWLVLGWQQAAAVARTAGRVGGPGDPLKAR